MKYRCVEKTLTIPAVCNLIAIITILIIPICSTAQTIIRGNEMKATNIVGRGTRPELNGIYKTWQESFDGNSRFKFQFFGIYDEPLAARKFPHEILVFDGNSKIDVRDWDSADCSIEKIILAIPDEKKIFLVVATRATSESIDIIPQNNPMPQIIKLYELRKNNDSAPGYSNYFFRKISQVKTSRLACDESDVYGLMENFIHQSVLKQKE